jgi:hypothetical protein
VQRSDSPPAPNGGRTWAWSTDASINLLVLCSFLRHGDAMGGKVEQEFQVEHWQAGTPGFQVIASCTNLIVARWAFWGAVDEKGRSLFAGDSLLLRHGARVILEFPPEQAKSRFGGR